MSERILIGLIILCDLFFITSALICIGMFLNSDKESKI